MKRMILMFLILFVLSLSSAWADTMYFAQDNFWLFFNNSPGEAGSQIISQGTLKSWATNTIVGSYQITGTNTLGAQPVGSNWVSTYDGALSVTLGAQTWTGTGSIYTNASYPDPDLGSYSAAGLSHPTWLNGPPWFGFLGVLDSFASLGGGLYSYAGGTLTYDFASIPWFGTYNWGYGTLPPAVSPSGGYPGGFSSYQMGNAQGELNFVPEPGTLLLLGCGIFGIGLLRKRLN